MGKKVTVCPECGKAGHWQGVKDESNKIKHQYCGTVFDIKDWIYTFKSRQFRISDHPKSWDEDERKRLYNTCI